MSDIILSAPVRSNLLSLQNTADLLGKTQERLATGLRVNSALDDPSAFFTAAGLNNRAGDLNRLLDSVGLAVNTIEAADAGISAITDLVEQAQATARQALQSPGPTTPATAATTTGTVDLGTDVAATLTGTVDLGTDVAATAVGTVDLGTDVAANIAGSGSTVDLTSGAATFSASGTLTVNGQTFAITGGSTTVTNLTTFLSGLSAAVDVTGSISGGELDFTADDNTTSISVTLTGGGAATLATELGIATTNSADPTNATVAALTGTSTITVGTDSVALDFDSAISNRGQLEAALAGLSTATATVNGSNFVSITASNNSDSIVFSGTTDDSTYLGGTIGDDATITPTNATVAALTGTSTITVGTDSVALDFDSAISTRGQLETALAGLSTATATVNGSNFLTVTASNNTDSIVFSGTTDDSTLIGGTLGDDASVGPTNATIAALTGTATITVGSDAVTFDFDSAISNRAQLEAAFSGLTTGTISIDGSNNLVVTAGNTTDSIVTGGTADTGLGLGDDATIAPGTGTPVDNATRAALETEFNNLLTQIDQLAQDTSFNGNNLLQSDDLTVIFNEDGTSSLTISGVDFDSGGLGINAATAGDFQTDSNIDTTLTELNDATTTLRTQASTFGSNLSVVEVRQDFTKELINVLETGASGLTLADTNEEGANLLSLQTRQQLSTISLSLATQADQNVLRLF